MAHKHADLIRAWADGAQIQVFSKRWKRWMDTAKPTWDDDSQYRIKTEQHIWESHMTFERNDVVAKMYGKPNLRLTFDGKTNELLSAEVLR